MGFSGQIGANSFRSNTFCEHCHCRSHGDALESVPDWDLRLEEQRAIAFVVEFWSFSQGLILLCGPPFGDAFRELLLLPIHQLLSKPRLCQFHMCLRRNLAWANLVGVFSFCWPKPFADSSLFETPFDDLLAVLIFILFPCDFLVFDPAACEIQLSFAAGHRKS